MIRESFLPNSENFPVQPLERQNTVMTDKWIEMKFSRKCLTNYNADL